MARKAGKTTASIPEKHGIERLLQQMRPHPSPRIWLEQYTIPADVVADVLWLAAVVYGDITGKDVIDLGTGTGRLAIGAAILGARRIIGVDIDHIAIDVARSNAVVAKADVEWLVGDLEAIHGSFDTVIMNPPFGTKRKHLDKIFLRKAMSIGRVVYSMHKSSTRKHILEYVKRCGGKASAIHQYTFHIPRMFEHHRKRSYPVNVDCYRLEVKVLKKK